MRKTPKRRSIWVAPVSGMSLHAYLKYSSVITRYMSARAMKMLEEISNTYALITSNQSLCGLGAGRTKGLDPCGSADLGRPASRG